MKLSENSKKTIVEELRYTAEKMKETKEPKGKLYYFSASYGIVNRILNLEFSPELVFIHLVLNTTYAILNERIASIESGAETVIKLPEKFYEKLIKSTEQLAEKIEKKEDFYKVLQDIALLGFVATGNGHYLYQKGKIKL